MKKIIAIGGAVIKTAKEELRKVIEDGQVEMLIHNGGSIFHDFQQEIEDLDSHSYALDDLMQDYSCNKYASTHVWKWVKGGLSPHGSITKLCHDKHIPVLLFTALGCDFWQMFASPDDWAFYGRNAWIDYKSLVSRFRQENFHYVCMGSAVIQPEVFTKALAEAKPKEFRADVVDFLDMYRPRTRVAQFGKYYKMTHKEYLTKCLI